MSKSPVRFDREHVNHLVDTNFPQIQEGNGRVSIERIDAQEAVVRMNYDDRLVRPGGTISGPAMFKLADFGVYVAILARLGEQGLQAVTTNMTMNFLSRPKPGDLVARIKVLKLGRRLAVCEVALFSETSDEMVAHATSTYALAPPSLRGNKLP